MWTTPTGSWVLWLRLDSASEGRGSEGDICSPVQPLGLLRAACIPVGGHRSPSSTQPVVSPVHSNCSLPWPLRPRDANSSHLS